MPCSGRTRLIFTRSRVDINLDKKRPCHVARPLPGALVLLVVVNHGSMTQELRVASGSLFSQKAVVFSTL